MHVETEMTILDACVGRRRRDIASRTSRSPQQRGATAVMFGNGVGESGSPVQYRVCPHYTTKLSIKIGGWLCNVDAKGQVTRVQTHLQCLQTGGSQTKDNETTPPPAPQPLVPLVLVRQVVVFLRVFGAAPVHRTLRSCFPNIRSRCGEQCRVVKVDALRRTACAD